MNEIDNMAFFYTHKCNVACAHCVYSCNSKRKEKMNPKTVARQLKEAKEAGIKKVGFSGGEPLLYKKELLGLIRKAKELGLRTSTISNGFWATDKNKTVQMINELKKSGLDELKISVGSFHQQFIPIENIVRILQEKETFYPILLSLYFDKTRDEDLLEIGELLSKQKKVWVGFSRIMPFGRAKKLPAKKFFYGEMIKEKCLFRVPVVTPNQDSFICCFGSLKGRNSLFFIGNAEKKPLKEIINEYRKNKLAAFLLSKSPFLLVKELKKRKIKPLKALKRKKFVFLCHYCVEQLSSYRKEDVMKVVNELV